MATLQQTVVYYSFVILFGSCSCHSKLTLLVLLLFLLSLFFASLFFSLSVLFQSSSDISFPSLPFGLFHFLFSFHKYWPFKSRFAPALLTTLLPHCLISFIFPGFHSVTVILYVFLLILCINVCIALQKIRELWHLSVNLVRVKRKLIIVAF